MSTSRPFARVRRRIAESAFASMIVFAATIYLTGLPTVYTVLTIGLKPGNEVNSWKTPAEPLLIVWVVCAVALGAIAFVKDSQLQVVLNMFRNRPTGLPERRWGEAGLRAVELLLEHGREARLLRSLRPQVFIPRHAGDETELVPLLKAQVRAWHRWPIGSGVIGYAFEQGAEEPWVFRRSQLIEMNSTLSDEQRLHYGNLTMVAAIVIRAVDGEPIGVLSVSSARPGPRFGASRQEALKLLAANLGVFLQLAV